MGDIRNYSCNCGYEERLYVGGGMNAINMRSILQMFPQEGEQLEAQKKIGQVGSYLMDHAVGTCKTCRRLYTVSRLSYEMQDGKVFCFIKPCPTCDSEVEVQEDIENLVCPKCGKVMSYLPAGRWD